MQAQERCGFGKIPPNVQALGRWKAGAVGWVVTPEGIVLPHLVVALSDLPYLEGHYWVWGYLDSVKILRTTVQNWPVDVYGRPTFPILYQVEWINP